MYCISSCSTFYIGQQCYSACPSSAPLVSSAGSRACVSSCSSNIYVVNGSANQCNSTCTMPNGLSLTALYSSGAYQCASCSSPYFVSRSNMSCISSCTYINSTISNSVSINVCEINTSSYCPYWSYLNSSSY